MRVAYVCTDPGVPVFGRKGCSIHVQAILNEMVATGCDVSLFARRWGGEVPAGLKSVQCHQLSPVKTRVTAERERGLAAGNRELGILLENAGPFDLVYERYALWSHAAMEFADDCGTPSILEINAPLVQEQATHRELVDERLARQITARAFAAAGTRLAVSQGVVDRLSDGQRPVNDWSFHVVPNGVSPERFTAARELIWQRQETGNQDDPFVVGFVGTLRPWHGLSTLGSAFSRLHATTPQARLLVVGAGAARDELESQLTPSALAATTITGAVDHSEVPSWVAKMDVAVAPYPAAKDFYFSPLKVLEYFAAGLPVVGSGTGTSDGLVNDRNMVVFEPGNAEEMAQRLQELQSDAALRQAYSRAAFPSISFDNTWAGVWQRAKNLSLKHDTPARSAG